VPERHVNNGQPSLHAHLIHRALPQSASTWCMSDRHGLLHRHPRPSRRAVRAGNGNRI
jgi:hypothetical protein